MKKWTIISIAVTVLALLSGVWLYLFFNGAPESTEDIFSNFQSQNNEVNNAPLTNTGSGDSTTQTPATDRELPPLRQITTTPVAGFTFYNKEITTNTSTSSVATSSKQTIRYAEQGTGHIYEIDPETNDRIRLSNRTIANTNEVYFSTYGNYVALLTKNNNDITITTIELTVASGTEATILGEKNVTGDNFAMRDDHLLYTTIEDNRATGKSLHLPSQSIQTLFTLPYIDTAVAWGENISESHFVYPKPHSGLDSYLYEVSGEQLYRTPVEGKNLSVIYKSPMLAYSYRIDRGRDTDTRNSFLYHIKDQTITPLANPVIKEKCVFTNNKNGVWCASGINNPEDKLQEWYRGEYTANDVIWYLDLQNYSSRLEVNVPKISGREVDIDVIKNNTTDTELLFRNQTDGTLWIYEL